MAHIMDMTQGVYRRIYAGFITSRRINMVSWEAEAWFWRLHAIADDFGNLTGDTVLLRSFASPLKKLSDKEIVAMTNELINAELIGSYTVNGDCYLHIHGFEERQPAGKSGRRLQKVPLYNVQHVRQNVESGGIRGNPEKSGALSPSHTHTHTHTHTHVAEAGLPTEFPVELRTTEFRTAWMEWEKYKRESRKPLRPTTINRQLKFLAAMGSAAAVASINQSITNGWAGLFAPDAKHPAGKTSHGGMSHDEGWQLGLQQAKELDERIARGR